VKPGPKHTITLSFTVSCVFDNDQRPDEILAKAAAKAATNPVVVEGILDGMGNVMRYDMFGDGQYIVTAKVHRTSVRHI
jgi:hypothetical protein